MFTSFHIDSTYHPPFMCYFYDGCFKLSDFNTGTQCNTSRTYYWSNKSFSLSATTKGIPKNTIKCTIPNTITAHTHFYS